MIQKSLTKKLTVTVDEAIKFLESKGYHVEKYDGSIPRLQAQIIKDFYTGLRTQIGDKRLAFLNVQDKEDSKAIDRFLKKSSQLGIPKTNALNYLHEVVKLLFVEYNNLGLTQPPTSLTFLLSHNGNWIIDKLQVILDNRVRDYDQTPEAVAYKESLYEIEDDKFLDLQKERHSKLLEDKYGKKD